MNQSLLTSNLITLGVDLLLATVLYPTYPRQISSEIADFFTQGLTYLSLTVEGASWSVIKLKINN
jgi:hypothetical protein